MDFTDGLFPFGWSLAAWVVLAPVFVVCARYAPWRRLAEQQAGLWFGAIVCLSFIWRMKAGVYPGLNLHLLGATALVLSVGPQLAILGLAAVVAVVTAVGNGGWQALPINILMMAVIPSVVAHTIFRVADRWLPNHFFIYILVNAFAGAGVTILVTGAAACALLLGAEAYPAELLLTQYLPYFLLLSFSEAWLSGGAVTLMVIYQSRWVSTFDDRRYLWNK